MFVWSSILTQLGDCGMNLQVTTNDEWPSNLPMYALVIETSGHHTLINVSKP